jgi:acetyl esterase/lipase
VSESILTRTPPPADARVAYGPDPLQFADLRLPAGDGPFPGAVVIHGGYWRSRYTLDHAGHLCAALTALGFATWSVEYRRVGDPVGGWPDTFHDVAIGAAALFGHADRLGIDPKRIAVTGHSAGGQLASWLASVGNVAPASQIQATPLPFRAVLSLAGVLDLVEGARLGLGNGAVKDFLGGGPDEVPDRYAAASPAALVPSPIPHVLIHGEGDGIVPIAISESYRDTAATAGGDVRLIPLPDTEHFEVIDPESPAWPLVAATFRSLLGN